MALVSAHFRTLLQYRAAALAGLGTQLFWGLIRVMIFEGFYSANVDAQPMELADVVTYVWLGQTFLVMLPWNVQRDVQALVRSGGVSYELLRPLDLYAAWFSRALAFRSAPTLLRAAPLLTIAILFLRMEGPDSWPAATAFVGAMAGALILSCAITTILTVSLLWTLSGQGLTQIVTVSVMIFSGNIVPLPFFHKWAQPILSFLPFRGLADTPYRLYMGHIPPGDLLIALVHQLPGRSSCSSSASGYSPEGCATWSSREASNDKRAIPLPPLRQHLH